MLPLGDRPLPEQLPDPLPHTATPEQCPPGSDKSTTTQPKPCLPGPHFCFCAPVSSFVATPQALVRTVLGGGTVRLSSLRELQVQPPHRLLLLLPMPDWSIQALSQGLLAACKPDQCYSELCLLLGDRPSRGKSPETAGTVPVLLPVGCSEPVRCLRGAGDWLLLADRSRGKYLAFGQRLQAGGTGDLPAKRLPFLSSPAPPVRLCQIWLSSIDPALRSRPPPIFFPDYTVERSRSQSSMHH